MAVTSGAGGAGQLDGERPDAARASVDEDAFARPEDRVVVPRLPGGEGGQRDGGGDVWETVAGLRARSAAGTAT